MKSLTTLDRDEALGLTTLLFDLDDTLLTHGRLTREAFGALHDLAEAGIDLLAVTGRPAGWGEVIARQWPVLGVVAENGAVLLLREGAGIAIRTRGGPESRLRDRVRLEALVAEARAAFPDIELADDVRARVTDVTFDVGERVKIASARVGELRGFLVGRGARTLLSSVHLHATFEGDDKASGALHALGVLRSVDPSSARVRAAFVGDSENDAACFSCFRTTIGVANVRAWVGRLSVPPRYVTMGTMGEGFAELARTLLERRKPR